MPDGRRATRLSRKQASRDPKTMRDGRTDPAWNAAASALAPVWGGKPTCVKLHGKDGLFEACLPFRDGFNRAGGVLVGAEVALALKR